MIPAVETEWKKSQNITSENMGFGVHFKMWDSGAMRRMTQKQRSTIQFHFVNRW